MLRHPLGNYVHITLGLFNQLLEMKSLRFIINLAKMPQRTTPSVFIKFNMSTSAKDINEKPRNKHERVIHEPPYLAELKPKVGYYELIDLQIKGYDFVVLEKYQGYLHRTMKKMDFNVVKAWSAPHQELLVETLADKSSAVENSYKIKIYERNLQMKDALVTKLPILIDIINMTAPPGVSFSISRHSTENEDRLYFKDSVLEKMKEEYQELKDTPLIGA